MSRGNPNLANMPHRGRKPKDSEPFYIIINDYLRVSKDNYQYVLAQRSIAKETGKAYEIGVKYYDSLITMAKEAFPEFSVTEEEAKLFLNRTKGITQAYKLGKMIVTVPDSIQFDKRDIPAEGESDEETDEETDTKNS